jgi:cardiolipin synthase
MENWLQARSEVLHGDDYFPKVEPVGSMPAQFFRSGPRDAAENARISYLMSIGAARTNIRMAHVYFVPSKVVLEALLKARQRGVKVEVIVPGKVDNIATDKASRSRWGKLLKSGVKFYEYQPSYYHCKIMIVDDAWVTAGSVNFDERSFRLNDEANLNVLSRELAAQLTESFERDKTRCRVLTERHYKRRGWYGRFWEQFFALFRSQL